MTEDEFKALAADVEELQSGGIEATTEKWQRLYNLVASLAHPNDDHLENALEDEAHDLIRELRGLR